MALDSSLKTTQNREELVRMEEDFEKEIERLKKITERKITDQEIK